MEFVNTLRAESCTHRDMVEGLVLTRTARPTLEHASRSRWASSASTSRSTARRWGNSPYQLLVPFPFSGC